MAPRTCLVQLKAFGDCVIASAAADRVIAEDRAALTLVIGEHLRPLCHAIAPRVGIVAVDTRENGVPSLFDLRRNGVPAAIRSAWDLRNAVARATIPKDSQFAFDRLGWRERWIRGRYPAVALPPATNIYDAYDQLLTNLGFRITGDDGPPTILPELRRAGIFPGSRLAHKNLPAALVNEIIGTLHAAGLQVDLFLLEGERPDLEESGLPYIAVPRDFGTLLDHIRSIDTIFSADSLPAHLAEAAGKEVFVLTPRPNIFWMPRSVWRNDRWCLFDADDRVYHILAFAKGEGSHGGGAASIALAPA